MGAAFARWARQRYGWSPDPEFVHTCVDVLQGVTAAVTALAEPGAGVILTPPIYHIFLQICPTARRRQLEWLMRYDRDRGWTLDPDDLEALVRQEPDARVLLWCHPHNPTGWVADTEVLTRIVELAHAYDFYVVSDEIHADLVYADSSAPFTPMLSIPGAAERVVTVTSPAKTFALSGLRCAVMAYGDRDLRRRVHQAHPPLLLGHAARTGIDATIAAWRHGAAWADGLVSHLAGLRDHLADRLAADAPAVRFHLPPTRLHVPRLAGRVGLRARRGPRSPATATRRCGRVRGHRVRHQRSRPHTPQLRHFWRRTRRDHRPAPAASAVLGLAPWRWHPSTTPRA